MGYPILLNKPQTMTIPPQSTQHKLFLRRNSGLVARPARDAAAAPRIDGNRPPNSVTTSTGYTHIHIERYTHVYMYTYREIYMCISAGPSSRGAIRLRGWENNCLQQHFSYQFLFRFPFAYQHASSIRLLTGCQLSKVSKSMV